MVESRGVACEFCGMWRLCFPGKVAGLRMRQVRIARGRVLYRSGDRVDAIYMIRSGCIKEIEGSTALRETVVNFALPGELLSFQSLGCQSSRTTGVAVEVSHVCVVPWQALNQLCANSPTLACEFMRLLAIAGAAARDSLSLIRDKAANQRIAGFLLNLCARMQVRGVAGQELHLSMNRDDIANYLGIRSETVSRCLTELARQELISVRAKRVQILNMDGLRRRYVDA